MPSSSGVYSLPSGYLAVTGQTIQASQHNPPLEDIAEALTNRLSRDGSAPMTGGLRGFAGSAALPGYAFATDTSSGLYKTTNGVGVAIGGAQVAEFTAAGMASGVRLLGEILPYTGATVPSALWVFPVGQTLSRTTYAAMWAFAQVQIVAGNTFYNNGDGSTTFGIGDLRGRTIAAIDNMGGTSADRLAPGGDLAAVRHTLGGAGGECAHTLTVAELPTGITSAGANSISVQPVGGLLGFPVTSSKTNITTTSAGSGGSVAPASSSASWGGADTMSGTNTISVTSSNTGGGRHNNIQPTMLCNFLLFVGAA
ncbi:tail fiber protein [Bradyrhizobium oligotrophicum S58]